MKFIIDKKIFEYFSNLKIIVVKVENLSSEYQEDKISKYLDDAWQVAKQAATQYTNPQSHPYIKAWGDSMKKIGVSRKNYPSSIEALVRRAGKNDNPIRINAVVDFYNAISLKNLVPAGGFDLDDLENDLELRLSKQGDTFLALDSSDAIEIPLNEVCYVEGDNVMTRHFVWKQSKHGILKPGSKNILFVSEILEELPNETIELVCNDFKTKLKEYFNADVNPIILDIDNLYIEL